MNYGVLVDTYAWLELFQGSDKGKKVREIIRGANPLCTSVLNIYELFYRIEQIRGDNTANNYIDILKSQAKILSVTPEIACKGALIKIDYPDMGAVDFLMYATAREKDLNILTGDQHFRNLSGVILI
jgi:predicted nucleic acid-binding protein